VPLDNPVFLLLLENANEVDDIVVLDLPQTNDDFMFLELSEFIGPPVGIVLVRNEYV